MITPNLFRSFMGCFTTGVAVVTMRDGKGAAVGVTVNSLASVSLNPPLILFSLDRTARSYPVFKQAQYFAVNILGAEQEDMSRHFADPHHYGRPPKCWDKPQLDCPILRRTLGWMVCKKVARHKGGDHDIFIGEAINLHKRSGKRDPLLYFHGRYVSGL